MEMDMEKEIERDNNINNENNDNNNNEKSDKKGFTLIELLAVIIIMAVLLMTALPAVTRTITSSRKKSYVTNAKKFIDAARTSIVDGDLYIKVEGVQTGANSGCQTPGFGQYVAVSISDIFLERGGDTSSFGKEYKEGYVVIVNRGTTEDVFDYYFVGIDKGNNGVDALTLEKNLTVAAVKNGNASAVSDVSGTACSGQSITVSGKSYNCSAVCKEVE